MAKTKEIHFSQARQKLSGIVDEVEKTGTPVTILRHGKPAVVVISAAEFQMKFKKRGNWMLAGSLKFRKSFDIDKALDEQSDRRAATRRLGLKRSAKEFASDD
jgi:prevent-host-death family protein